MNNLIDSHFHLVAMAAKGVDIKNFLDNFNLFGGIDIGTSVDDLPTRNELLKDYKNIKVATGIGPWGVELDVKVASFASFIKKHNFDFIGEIGLDFYWNYGTVEQQVDLFQQQIDLADEMGKPIIIHSRDADKKMGEVLKSNAFNNSGIMHCYLGEKELLKQALDSNFYISFAGPITYKKNDWLRELVKYTPTDRLLFETDSPYLSPEPYRGKVNTPNNVELIYRQGAKIVDIEFDNFVNKIKNNWLTLIKS
ncbi:MAG: TatD family hydrolase [Sphaerochaetaceae bacterium]|jgi:TatD DNase family protein